MGSKRLKPGWFDSLDVALMGAVVEAHEALSFREVAERVGVSMTLAWSRLSRMKEAGLVTWEPSLARTLRPTVEIVWQA